MKKEGFKLDFDMAAMSFMQGSAKSISGGNDSDYVSKIELIAPFSPNTIPDGIYAVEYKNDQVDVRICTINSREDDPLLNSGRNFRIGTPVPDMPTLPFEVFTDNRGHYPAVLVSMIFPRRIATWVDDRHETGIKMDYDYEAMRVTGLADISEKIVSLVVLNRLIASLSPPEQRTITYDEVTVFSETYFDKKTENFLVYKITALASKDAYKKAVYDHLFPDLNQSGLEASVNALHENLSVIQIENENDLKNAVEVAIDDILKHHIELRRWIEPFWDGERTVSHNGTDILVPRTPKGEIKIQPTLHVVLDMGLSPIGIQVIRETDEGAGYLDFRFLYTTKSGTPLSVGVEFKLAHHKRLKHGIESQLPTYLRAIRSKSGIFVVMWFKDAKYFREPQTHDKDEMEAWLNAEAINVSHEKRINVSARLLDASIRPSASTN